MSLTLSAPDITELEINAVASVLRSGRLSLGPWMEEFERRVSEFVRMPFGIAVSSGTAALHLCLVALGIGPGDEVIVPSFTFIAAANAIRYVGATPVFVDIETNSLNMDPLRVEEAITGRTRALLVVHNFGRAASMRPLLQLARAHHLRVIEDACEALGATYDGQYAGGFGDAAAFAFYPNKQITTGEGGMIVTRDAALAGRLRALRNQGRAASDQWHEHSLLGFNYRLSEMQCALGATQTSRLPEILAARAAVAGLYTDLLKNEPRVELPCAPEAGSSVSWFVYVIRLRLEAISSTREQVMRLMAAAGVPTGRYFAPIHEQPAYADFQSKHNLPVTESESRRTLALPFSTRLSREEVHRVVDALQVALGC